MSFGFRKSFSSGPFRTTLSKRGLSVSLGAGGARITSGTRGTYVTFSKGGFYYRQRVGQPATNRSTLPSTPPQPEPVAPTPIPNDAPVRTETPAPAPEIFGDVAPDEVVRAINDRITRRDYYSVPIGLAISGALAAFSTPWPVVAFTGTVIIALLSLRRRKSRYSALHYEEDKETAIRLEGLHKAVSSLRSCGSVWAVREASLALGLTPRPATLSRAKVACEPSPLPKYLQTNITPAALQLSDATLYFFPDRLFIWHSHRFSAVNYPEIKLRFSRVRFLERESQPSDALADGGLRRSLLDETRIPTLWYGSVEFDAAPALQLRLMTSRPESAQEFIMQLRGVTGGTEAATSHEGGIAPLYTHFDSARVPLFYDLSAKTVQELLTARDAFNAVARCHYVWRYEGERDSDWKRNAGASTLVSRSRIIPELVDNAPGVESNALTGFSFGSTTLYLLPDGWVIGSGNTYQAVGRNLHINVSTVEFRETDYAPQDGEITGKTWRYVNKDGGPDRRFNDNRQIPIYRYGQIFMTCGNWHLNLCVSRAAAARSFAAGLSAALKAEREDNGTREESREPPPKRKAEPANLAAAFRQLGLEPGASFDEVSAAYRSRAAQNHPDKVAQMAPEFRELAERRMRELNDAYEQIRASFPGHG